MALASGETRTRTRAASIVLSRLLHGCRLTELEQMAIEVALAEIDDDNGRRDERSAGEPDGGDGGTPSRRWLEARDSEPPPIDR